MGRTGPRLKVIRRLGTPLPGLTQKDAERKPYPPGEQGVGRRRRRRKTEYRERLEEKQKVRLNYGVTESQLRGYFEEAKTRQGPTGAAFLELLERRLDNVVFRLGFARTIPAARQLVVHGHLGVNDSRVDRPGRPVRIGDRVALTERARGNPHVQESVESGPRVTLPSYLEIDPSDPYEGRVVKAPDRTDVPVLVNESAIVEFYAR